MVTFIKTSPTFVNHGSMGEAEEKKNSYKHLQERCHTNFCGPRYFLFLWLCGSFWIWQQYKQNKTTKQQKAKLSVTNL